MRDSLRVLRALPLGLLLSCGQDSPSSSTSKVASSATASSKVENAELGGEVAARVGSQPIPLAVVRSVANAQRLSPRDALDRVIDDEIAAAGARARGLDKKNPASSRLTAARARFVSDRLREDARKQGPPTDQEIEEISTTYWQVADRPPAVRTIHAIVLRPDKPHLLADARRLASDIREAVSLASSDDEFKAKAEAVQHAETLKVKVEVLPPITSDGWITEGGGGMDQTFSKAAHAIADVGGMSPVIETQFGFHVIRLTEKIPEKRMPMEMRRVAFAEQIYTQRARALYDKTLKPLRETTRIEISPAAEQLMRTAVTSPEIPGVAAGGSTPPSPSDGTPR